MLQRPATVAWRQHRQRAPVVRVRLVEGVKPRHVLEGQQPLALGARARPERGHGGDLAAILPDVLGGAAARDDADAVVEGPADHDGERGDAVLRGDLGPDSEEKKIGFRNHSRLDIDSMTFLTCLNQGY